MFGWIFRGLRTGVVTTRYPRPELSGPSGGLRTFARTVPSIDAALLTRDDCMILDDVCPTSALSCQRSSAAQSGSLALTLNYAKCISCAYCADAVPGAISMSRDFELAARKRDDERIVYIFGGDECDRI